jgi:two-component system, OmpR family, sensor histidine kinase KdpD
MGAITSLAGVALTTLLIAWLRSHVEIPNVSMLYLPVVMAIGIVFGRASAIGAALVSFLAFNYFFVSPVATFLVANPQEWLELIILLLTAVVTGHLAATMRTRAGDAETREREVAALYECHRLLEGGDPLEQRLMAAVQHLSDFYAAPGCEVLLPDAEGHLRVRASSGVTATGEPGAEDASVWAFEHGAPATSDRRTGPQRWVRIVQPALRRRGAERGVICLPVSLGDRQIGVLRLVGNQLERASGPREIRHMVACAGLIGQAVERDRLTAEALETEVLRRADQAKSALLASVSHDLRTPLASIKASVTSLLDEALVWPTDTRRELLRGVDEETDRLTRFVYQLLELSRLESGAVQPRKEWHSIEEILAGVADRLDPSGARIRAQTGDSPSLVRLDYVMVEQIVTNLVENALKYSPPDAPVLISACIGDAQLSIDVVDKGPGIAPHDRDRVFDRFYRAHATRAAPGTGLGLSIARGLSRVHGGDVTYQSNSLAGSTFRLTLPLEHEQR